MYCLNLHYVLELVLEVRCPLFPYTTLFRSNPPHVTDDIRKQTRPASRAAAENHLQRFALTLVGFLIDEDDLDRKSTRLNSSHQIISYAVFCLNKKKAKWRARVMASWSSVEI